MLVVQDGVGDSPSSWVTVEVTGRGGAGESPRVVTRLGSSRWGLDWMVEKE
jgi:hypothetical protein